MIKERKDLVKKISLRVGIGFLAFASGLAAAFFLVPNRIRDIVFEDPVVEEVPATHFSRFVTKVMDTIDVDKDQKMEGVTGSIDELTIKWPDNKVVIDGSLALEMRNLNDFDVTVDLGVDYNSKKLDLGIGYTGRTFYLALEDLFIKSSYINTMDFFKHLNTLFFNPDVPAEEGLGIELDIDSVIDKVIEGVDLESLMAGMSGGGDGLSIVTGEEVETEDHTILAPISIALGEEPIEIELYLNKETDDLAGVNLKRVKFGDIEISGKIEFKVFKGHPVYPFTREEYDGRRNYVGEGAQFIEVINYKSWFNDIFDLLNTKKVGLDLNFSVDQDDGTGAVNVGQINGAIDVDASKFVLPIPKVINGDTFSQDKIVKNKVIKRGENGEESVVEEILDNLVAGVDLDVSRAEEKYANLNLTYADQAAYLSLNDAVLKAKMDVQTLNFVIDKVSTLVEGSETEKARKIVRGEKPEEGLFDFITGSELVTAIKGGHYEGIIDVLESISNNGDGLDLVLNLSSLGLGENAKVKLNLDATDNGQKGVTSIVCEDIEMAEGIFNLDLSTRQYKQANIDKVLNVKDDYQDLDFAVGVLDQVSSILDSKKASFNVGGSILGEDRLGMSFDGRGQLDYGERYGFGDLNIYNHKNPDNVEEKTETHPISLYVDNTTDDKEVNDMKLAYGPTKALKGKLSVKSLEDILGVVIGLIEKNDIDRRFAKFLDPIVEMIYNSTIGKIISSKDYMKLARQDFVKSIAQNSDGTYLELLLSDQLFAGFVNGDLKIHLNFKVVDDVKQLAGLEIIDLKLSEDLGSKIINLKVDIDEFDSERELPLNLNDTYMNFSSLATLVQFGIDSTELNCYHLTAEVLLNLAVIDVAKLNLDFYIEVDGENTKVYGQFPNIPYIIVASNDAFTDVNSEFLFEPSKHYDAGSSDNIGGYFHIVRNEAHAGILSQTFQQYYYRSTSRGFLDNIVGYLLTSVLDFRYSLIEKIGNINLDTTAGVADYEHMFQNDGFVYSEPAAGKSKWDVKMNLDKVSGISALKSLDASLSGSVQKNGKGEDRHYLNALDGTLVIKASIVTINVDAKIRLEDIDSSAKSWKDQFPDVDKRFEDICNVYNNMSESEKRTYDSQYLNKPGEEYRIRLDKKTPSIFK